MELEPHDWKPQVDPEAERLHERTDAARQRGWTIRYDASRCEYLAARELHVKKALGDLLDEIEEEN